MKYNKKGFSLVIGMGLTILMTLTAYVILSYMIPFTKNVKGIEQSTSSYYHANTGIEEGMYFVKSRANLTTENSVSLPTSSTGYSIQTDSTTNRVPKLGQGNSEYNLDYNQISLKNPLQLRLGGAMNWSNVSFVFKVPEVKGGSLTLSGGTSLPIVNWMLIAGDDTLFATGTSLITANKIVNNTVSLGSQNGFLLDNSTKNFQDFYDEKCLSSDSCILKMGVINDIRLTSGEYLPYLEYNISFPSAIANRYTTLQASGKSYGFQKNLEVKIPQETINQAFDFTVFQ